MWREKLFVLLFACCYKSTIFLLGLFSIFQKSLRSCLHDHYLKFGHEGTYSGLEIQHYSIIVVTQITKSIQVSLIYTKRNLLILLVLIHLTEWSLRRVLRKKDQIITMPFIFLNRGETFENIPSKKHWLLDIFKLVFLLFIYLFIYAYKIFSFICLLMSIHVCYD